MNLLERFPRLRPSYVRAGLRASGTAADLRRLIAAVYRLRNLRSKKRPPTHLHHPLKIVAHLPNYPPHLQAGSEVSMRSTIDYLKAQGHRIEVVIDVPEAARYVHRGTPVYPRPSTLVLRRLYRSCDLVMTQKSSSIRAYMLASRYGKPLAFFVRDIGEWRKLPGHPHLLVLNAEWQRYVFEYEGNSLVLHPPIDPETYRTTPGSRVTLINLKESKGGELFLELVTRMPDVDFLAVAGVWGDAMIPSPIPANLEVVPPSEDVREIYAKTRVLLMPSKRWESFGRVAVEAALSGIPVVASPNPGSWEAMGSSAIYASLSDPGEWEAAIRSLQDREFYARMSKVVTRKAIQQSSTAGLAGLEAALRRIATER